MNKTCIPIQFDFGLVKKTLVTYLCVIVFMLIGSISAAANTYVQIGKEIKISMKKAYIKDILWEVEHQTGIVFMYNEEELDHEGKVDINVKSSDINEILDACFVSTNLTYVTENDVIVIKPIGQKQVSKEITITGIVKDENKDPLPGVTVVIKELKKGVATDVHGLYILKIPDKNKKYTIVYSFIGMITQTVEYTGQKKIDIVLKYDKKQLDKVVVTGYTTLDKESFTGTATVVKQEELLRTNSKSVIAALQVFDPSFRIKENTLWGSDPNFIPEFNIRGESSLAMNKGLDVERERRKQRTTLKDNPNLPIFILDGFEVSAQQIYDMDMHRIASMTILKDAAATALHGSRAANGVVVVTSVAPKVGELLVNYSLTTRFEFPDLSDYNLANAKQKLEIEKLAGLYDRSEGLQAWGNQDYNIIYNEVARGVNTDWLALPLRNSTNTRHYASIGGGVETIRYVIDLSYDNNKGAMKGSYRNRGSAGLSLDYRHKKWLQILNKLTYTVTDMQDSPYGSFSQYGDYQPYSAIYDENGDLLPVIGLAGKRHTNPIWLAQKLSSYTGKGSIHDLTNNMSVIVNILKDLKFTGAFSISKLETSNESFSDPNDPKYSATPNNRKGNLDIRLNTMTKWNLNALLQYNKLLKNHFVNITAGINAQSINMRDTRTYYTGFGVSFLQKPIFASDQLSPTGVFYSKSRLFGVLGTVNYSYRNTYIFDASFRLDGSSKFGRNKMFAPFWSLGAGINIHNYQYFQERDWIKTFKVKATYGSTGNVNIPLQAIVDTYSVNTEGWYATGPAANMKYLGNPDLTWEKTNTLDLGLSMGFFDDKLYFDFNYYRKQTVDLISEISIRPSSGFEKYSINSGSILNKGFEFKLNTILFQNQDWLVAVSGNIASNHNEITELGKGIQEYNKKIQDNYEAENPEYGDLLTTPLIQYYVGASTSSIYAVRSKGIDPSNGKEEFIKKNGTTTYQWVANDQVVVGNTLPTAQGAFSINLAYKGIFLTTSFMYEWGGQSYNQTLLDKVENANITYKNVDLRVLTERWKKPGDLAPFYDIKNTVITRPTSRFVQDNNILKFNNISIGYDFKSSLISKIKLTSLSVRFSANDLAHWSSIRQERGIGYPYAKHYSFSLNMSF